MGYQCFIIEAVGWGIMEVEMEKDENLFGDAFIKLRNLGWISFGGTEN